MDQPFNQIIINDTDDDTSEDDEILQNKNALPIKEDFFGRSNFQEQVKGNPNGEHFICLRIVFNI